MFHGYGTNYQRDPEGNKEEPVGNQCRGNINTRKDQSENEYDPFR
jgi:hypothetical protein